MTQLRTGMKAEKGAEKVCGQGEASGHRAEELSRQRGGQWEEPEQEARLTRPRDSKDSDAAAVEWDRDGQDQLGGTAHRHRRGYAEPRVLNCTPGPGEGREVREVPGSLVDLAFPLSETGSYCTGF